MKKRKARAWELIDEDDGSQTMVIEYDDGTRSELRGVKINSIEDAGASAGSIALRLIAEKKP